MRLTKTGLKKLIGYVSSIVVLVFLGEDFLSGTGEVLNIFTGTA